MKTKDHEEIARYLVDEMEYTIDRKLKSAFLLGSIEPDYNPITYLRGTIREQSFRGHNYENAHECMKTLIQKIYKEGISEKKQYYLLGKLVHYIADAFTFPHNTTFQGSLKEHCSYETELHEYVKGKLNWKNIVWCQNDPEVDLMDQIEHMHENYLEESAGYDTDCCYILNAVTLVFGCFWESKYMSFGEKIA